MRVGNHITVTIQPGTHKAMKNAARKIPRRRLPPRTAHVLIVKTTVIHRSAPGILKKQVIVDLLSGRHMHSTTMPEKTLKIRISHGMFE